MNVLINYANEPYRKAQKLNSWTGKHIAGFDKVIEYGPGDVDADFRSSHQDIFSYQRGNGLWLWKSYLFYETLKNLPDGDTLFYADSGAFWIRNAQPIFEIIEREEIYVSAIPLIERQFTKRYLFDKIGLDYGEYGDMNQIQGGFVGAKKTRRTLSFFREWLDDCCRIDLICPDRYLEGSSDMLTHREDQSILSLLCKKHGIAAHKDPTQCGKVPEQYRYPQMLYRETEAKDTYPPLLVLHRRGSPSFRRCMNQYLKCVLPRRISLKFMKNEL